MPYDTDYYWVVSCKNRRFHHKNNTSYEHLILLGETDSFASPPMLPELLKVRCDSCGEEHSYKRKEVLRAEVGVPDQFAPHPAFK
ncbi:MAG TPA: hypothetical protein VKV39_15845 [Candidatus Sulfotelmatobacter sp.]|nr:hypothetical protein [Candidatus Sulfotelmatobacter sp.]